MVRQRIEYFIIEVIGGEGFSANLHCQTEKHELYISPTGRLCGPAAAMIESHNIAERFAEALMPRMQKKYGASINLIVAKCTTMGSPNSIERSKDQIKKNTEKITEWLEANEK